MLGKRMAINRIYSDTSDYKVGEDEIAAIELTYHGSKDTTIYKVTYEDESILFVGVLEHEVERTEESDDYF